uniref:Uncharacterized protein n=1 Tax=Arundo donax TaxID=35708 RepID=A0A0A9C0B0_ARUDO
MGASYMLIGDTFVHLELPRCCHHPAQLRQRPCRLAANANHYSSTPPALSLAIRWSSTACDRCPRHHRLLPRLSF